VQFVCDEKFINSLIAKHVAEHLESKAKSTLIEKQERESLLSRALKARSILEQLCLALADDETAKARISGNLLDLDSEIHTLRLAQEPASPVDEVGPDTKTKREEERGIHFDCGCSIPCTTTARKWSPHFDDLISSTLVAKTIRSLIQAAATYFAVIED
jgi:hypothetical protein